jgi:hypothetical protein
MRRLLAAACAVAAIAMPRVAAAQADHAEKSKKAELHVSREVIVGTKALTPGDYRFQCKMIDGKHYLVVETADGDTVTKVPCEPETLSKPIERSEFRSVTSDSKTYLTAVRIKGETVAHRVAPGV